jgi:hypothetical protein
MDHFLNYDEMKRIYNEHKQANALKTTNERQNRMITKNIEFIDPTIGMKKIMTQPRIHQETGRITSRK